jgi:cell division protein FtsI/penicillin-binding protein 2
MKSLRTDIMPGHQQPAIRFWLIGGALTLAGLIIFLWMIRIQTSEDAKKILENAKAYTYVRKTIYPERGNIYDRWGHLLAGNIEVYEVGADMRYVEDPQSIAMTLSTLLGLDYERIYPALSMDWDPEKPGYVVLSNNVPAEKMEMVKILQEQMADQAKQVANEKERKAMPSLRGLIWTPHLQRSYPEHALGSNILGFFSYLDRDNGRGYFGVEEKYNHLLAGTPVDVVVPQDPYLITEPPNIPPGSSLVLTIDREIQAMAERIIDKAVLENGADSGTLIITDPRNGEILAMASTPRLDPNEYWNYQEIFPAPTPYNRAIGQTYEPGSVFKILTMAAGLDSGAVEPTTSFLDTGTIVVGGVSIHNWDRGAWGPQDMIGCMQHSLNVCLAWIATELGPSRFYSYMKNFGVGNKTGVDLAGEVSWPLSVQGDQSWYPVNLGTNSFGQGVATTPMQMIMAAGALANDGKMMSPHVLRTVIESDKQYSNPPQVIGQPISAETAQTLTEMLAQSLEKESSVATVEGYRMAGKTGTAEIPGPYGYSSDRTNASFVGWGPADDPRFVVYVWLERPTTSIWGSVVAAPVFKETVENLVILLDLPPDSVRQQIAADSAEARQNP